MADAPQDQTASEHAVTKLLNQWSRGDREALDQLMPLLYHELHKLAKRHMSGQREDHTLQTTAVIHEAYVRLASGVEQDWESRSHFLTVAAKVMRHVLVDHARSRRTAKRGGELRIVPLEDGLDVAAERAHEIIALDDGLKTLAAQYPRQAEAVELRYFGGLGADEVARVLKVSAETVGRDWRFARSFLRRELSRREITP